jgi:hypothetical protein
MTYGYKGPSSTSGKRKFVLGTKCRPQSDHAEKSDLTKRFFIAGWERERAKREGQGLKYPSVRLGMI